MKMVPSKVMGQHRQGGGTIALVSSEAAPCAVVVEAPLGCVIGAVVGGGGIGDGVIRGGNLGRQ